MEFIKRELRIIALMVSKILVWWVLFESIVFLDKNFNLLEKAGIGALQSMIFVFVMPVIFTILFFSWGKKCLKKSSS